MGFQVDKRINIALRDQIYFSKIKDVISGYVGKLGKEEHEGSKIILISVKLDCVSLIDEEV